MSSSISDRLAFPRGPDKPLWSSMFGAVPMLYVFWEPLRSNAPLSEWLWTILSFFVFLVLATLGAIYWSRTRVMARVCVAMATLAVIFTVYRPSGILYFLYVAAFVPVAVSGRLVSSSMLIAAAATMILLQWWLLWPIAPMPFVVAFEALIIGGAVTFVVREQGELRNVLKTAEQERIARDLHDVLGHTLSVIILKAEVANRLSDTDWERAKQEMRDVENVARHALSEVRDAISGNGARNLRSEIDSAKAALRTAEISIEDQFNDVSLPEEVERAFSLVLREAVTNVVRHAQATRCRLSLEKADGAYRMQVCDNGRGRVGQEGFGMRGIQNRLTEIGGTALWSHDAGTRLTVTVPVRSDAHN